MFDLLCVAVVSQSCFLLRQKGKPTKVRRGSLEHPALSHLAGQLLQYNLQYRCSSRFGNDPTISKLCKFAALCFRNLTDRMPLVCQRHKGKHQMCFRYCNLYDGPSFANDAQAPGYGALSFTSCLFQGRDLCSWSAFNNSNSLTDLAVFLELIMHESAKKQLLCFSCCKTALCTGT